MSNEAAAVSTAKEFVPVHDSKREMVSVDVRSIVSNMEQPRGRGVLAGLMAAGWKCFPNDSIHGKAKVKGSVIEELVSDVPERQAAMLNQIVTSENSTDSDSIFGMVNSLEQNGQLQAIRIRSAIGENEKEIDGEFNVIFGARRAIARAVQYAMSCVFKGEDGVFRPCAEGEKSNYTGLSVGKHATTDGLPLLEAEMAQDAELQGCLMAALAENQARKNQSPIDEAIFFRQMKAAGIPVKEIALRFYGPAAKEINKDQLVTQRLTLLRLTPEEQERVHLGKLGIVAALGVIKAREANKKGSDATPADKPGQGERAKMPSVAQAKELFYALEKVELSEEVKERFGKAKVWDLTRNESVRQFIAVCTGEKYLTLQELVAQKAAEAAAAVTEAGKAAIAKGKGKGKKKATETPTETPTETAAA